MGSLTTITVALVTLTILHNALGAMKLGNCQCGRETGVNVASRIIGGKKVKAGKYPWMVLLKMTKEDGTENACTGAIINDKFVLTASHCLDGITKKEQIEVFSDQKLTARNQMFKESKPLKVGNFFKKEHTETSIMKDDIALVELEKSLTFTDSFGPVCLTPSVDHKNYFAAGWGYQYVPKMKNEKPVFDKSSKERFLKEITFNRVPDTECHEKVPSRNLEYQVCVRGDTKGFLMFKKTENICVGDSGGPLMTRSDGRVSVMGVASVGFCNMKLPNQDTTISTYEKLDKHKEFIRENTKEATWCQGSSPDFAWDA